METLVSIFSNLSCSENSLAAAQKISEIFSTAAKEFSLQLRFEKMQTKVSIFLSFFSVFFLVFSVF